MPVLMSVLSTKKEDGSAYYNLSTYSESPRHPTRNYPSLDVTRLLVVAVVDVELDDACEKTAKQSLAKSKSLQIS